MIYFLLNNNYQYHDFARHLNGFDKGSVGLIEIPHTLDERMHTNIGAFHRYDIARNSGILSQCLKFLFAIRRIKREISLTKEDILFFYTEYEILNQYIVDRFKCAGARVFLIEDGGLGTYVPFRFTRSEPLTLKEWLQRSIYRCLPGLSKVRFLKLNGALFPQMTDLSIDAVLLYNPVKLLRNIETILLKKNSYTVSRLVKGRVIFLNEPIYQLYQNDKDYLVGLRNIIEALCLGYKEVLFKFHPRENIEWRNRIRREVLSFHQDVLVLEEDTEIEVLVEKYLPVAAASYVCSALLTLSYQGIQPVYLYQLIPDLARQPAFKEATLVLNEIGYRFILDYSEVGSDYSSKLEQYDYDQHSKTLDEVIESYTK